MYGSTCMICKICVIISKAWVPSILAGHKVIHHKPFIINFYIPNGNGNNEVVEIA
jgi:hypothetical protein